MLSVSISQIRIVVLALSTVMLLGSAITPSASAEEVGTAGPFWVHRPTGGKGQEKIEPKAPENFRGAGSRQTFQATVGTTILKMESEGIQVKGAIFNGLFQGEIKAELIYKQPRLVEPKLPECNVTIGTKNIIVAKGFLSWKWNGEKKQLEEKPIKEQTVDGIISSDELPRQKPPVEVVNLTRTGSFTTVTLSAPGNGCGVIAGKYLVLGSYTAIPNRKLGEFAKTLSIRVVEPPKSKEKELFMQHYWTGEAMQGAEVGLVFAGNPAFYFLGQTEVEAEQQEVGVIE